MAGKIDIGLTPKHIAIINEILSKDSTAEIKLTKHDGKYEIVVLENVKIKRS